LFIAPAARTMGGGGAARLLDHRLVQARKYRVREKARWSPSLLFFCVSQPLSRRNLARLRSVSQL
jgi:hypothetical protein